LLTVTVLALIGAALLASVAAAAPVTPTDYSQRSHWLYLPSKSAPHKRVAIFYLYPTAYVRAPGEPLICAVDDPQMMAGAAVALQRQATAFRTVGNIYAPYYRQADAASRSQMTPEEQVKVVAGAPTIDAVAAFKYFINHYDRSRPFILVGHSLGSNVTANLLADFMGTHPRIRKRMVAAYVVGYSITPDYLAKHPFLKFAKGPNDTGVIVSWNTEAPTVDGTNPVLLSGGLAINPITWTRKETEAPAAKNLGSIELDPATGGTPVLNPNGSIKRFSGLADARVDKAKGVVVCSTVPADQPPYFTPGGFPQGVLHPFDYPLYFFSVRANAADRVAHYFAGR
jgi:pimeloyl-ACP methyl ester carboxylesterase